MTILEKIKRLKWFDSISKLRDILEEIYNSSSGGSGGNQDLQSVLENGSEATINENLIISADDILLQSNDTFTLAINNKNFRVDNSKIDGTYTLATTDDILKINLDSRVYANNAAAITGGLTTRDLYRTSTGELRIVV
jgi:hypothetical protein